MTPSKIYRFVSWGVDKDGCRTILDIWECDAQVRKWWKMFYHSVRHERRYKDTESGDSRARGLDIEIGAHVVGEHDRIIYSPKPIPSVRKQMRTKIYTKQLIALDFEFEILREERRDLERKLLEEVF